MTDLTPVGLISTVDASSSVTSVPYDIGHNTVFSVQVNFSGANLVGTLSLEASLDKETWVQVTDSDQAVTASADHQWSVLGAAYRYVRAKWVYTSGAGNITVKAITKRSYITGA